jgi:predicted ATPase
MRYAAAAIGMTYATAEVRREQAVRRARHGTPGTVDQTAKTVSVTGPAKSRSARRGLPRFTRPASA